ncbi:Peptidase C51 domain-containing protein [Plasmodiophora brassicae]
MWWTAVIVVAAVVVGADARAPFGDVLGVSHGGVQVRSCHAESPEAYREALRAGDPKYHAFLGGVFTGFQWQCVELARRYLVVNAGVAFDDVVNAYQIWDLDGVRRVADGERVAWRRFANGSRVRPEIGSLLIWSPAGFYEPTGHVAVVVAVGDAFVDIVEQNVDDTVWETGQTYSRRLKARSDDGSFTVVDDYDGDVIGWIIMSIVTTERAPAYDDESDMDRDEL